MSDHIPTWLQIGNINPWIRGAGDPPFTQKMFHQCQDAEELEAKLRHGNWALGQAFYLGDLCFINQVNGGDEWLGIFQDTCFESITWEIVIRRGGFKELLERMQAGPDVYWEGRVPKTWWGWDNVEKRECEDPTIDLMVG